MSYYLERGPLFKILLHRGHENKGKLFQGALGHSAIVLGLKMAIRGDWREGEGLIWSHGEV
jgi:hypothetical protein